MGERIHKFYDKVTGTFYDKLTEEEYKTLQYYYRKERYMLLEQDVIGLAYSLGLKFAEHKQYNIARYLYEIVYGLTEMEEIKELLDGLTEEE